jgi:anaerobic selenocysteine-containing dehydrogenase
MGWTTKKSRFSSLPKLRRRSFLKIGVGAYASLIYGCGSQKSRSSSSVLLKGEREWVSSVCTLCPSACTIRAYSEAGRIVAVGGDPDDPNTGGKLCPIGLSVLNIHNNPDRLKEAFQKGKDGKMTEVQTVEITGLLDLIADQIRRGGALHIYGRITPDTSKLSKIINATCHMDPLSEGMTAYPSFLNTDGRPPILDFDNARIAFLFDSNFLEHGYPYVGYVRRITEARQRGMRLVTFSPFLTNTATAGDWIPIRSREAASLASLAIAQQALNDLDQQILPPPPEITDLLRSLDRAFLERATGLSHETIRDLSRRFFGEPGPAVSDLHDPSILLLNIMKRNLNRPGGLLHPGQRNLQVEAGFGNIAQLLRDRRNVVFINQSNPAFSQSSEIRPILQSSDRAMVVCIDSFMSETAELSDFVLPLASPLETLTCAEPLPLGKPFIAAAPQAVRPQSSCCQFEAWLQCLAIAMHISIPRRIRSLLNEAVGNESARLRQDQAIHPRASDPKPLEARMPDIISSFKTQIAFALKLQASHESPLQPKQYFLSTFEESIQGPVTAPSKWLDEISYSPKIYLHPQRAGRLGIRSGDTIVITSSHGAATEGIALLFEGVHPDALVIPQHHGHTGFGRVARGEPFMDPVDPDMSRIFWGKNRGVNPADLNDTIVEIRKKRG